MAVPLLAATQGMADDRGGRRAWIAVIVAVKPNSWVPRPTCRQGPGWTLGKRFLERAKGPDGVVGIFCVAIRVAGASSTAEARCVRRWLPDRGNARVQRKGVIHDLTDRETLSELCAFVCRPMNTEGGEPCCS